MNERLKQVRKTMNKTQKDFGGMLGVSRDTYASYETGRVIPNDTFIQLLCSIFNVNEEWLRNGNGEMFTQTSENILDELAIKHGLTDKEKAILSAFLDLSPDGRAAIIDYVEKMSTVTSALTRNKIIADDIKTTQKKIEQITKKEV